MYKKIFYQSNISRKQLGQSMKNKLIILLSVCIGISLSPIVLLMYGLGSFKVSSLVGDKNVTEWFSYCSAVVSLAMIIVGPSSGYIADRLSFWLGSRKFCIWCGSVIGGLSLLGFAISSKITPLIICWIFAQFGYGLVGAACFAMIASNVEYKFLGRAYSIVGASIPLSVMAASILLMELLSTSSLLIKLSILASMQLIICLISSLLLADTLSIKKHHKIDLFLFRNFYPSIKIHPNFSLVFLSKLCFGICMAGMKMMPLFYIARFHIDEQKYTILMHSRRQGHY